MKLLMDTGQPILHVLLASLVLICHVAAPLASSVNHGDCNQVTNCSIGSRNETESTTLLSTVEAAVQKTTRAPSTIPPAPQERRLSVGLLVPHTTFKVREYSRAVISAMASLRKQELTFLNSYKFQPSDIHTDMLKVNPSPTGEQINQLFQLDQANDDFLTLS